MNIVCIPRYQHYRIITDYRDIYATVEEPHFNTDQLD
jgi:hypothetical protein